MENALNILVVEDDTQIQEFMSSIIEITGCSNDSAFDGINALKMIDNRSYDLIFLDLEIPEVHGLEVLSQIGIKHPASKTVILTGYASKESAIRALKEGAYDFIEKPFSIHQITKIIHNIKEEKNLERDKEKLLRELRQTKNFLENIYSNIDAGIIVCEKDGMIISFNNQASKICSIDGDGLKGKNINNIFTDTKFEDLFLKMKEGLLTSTVKEESVIPGPNGTFKFVIISISPLIEDEIKGYISHIDDITDKIRLKEMLFLSEEKYKNLVERANDCIFRLDIDGKFLFCNKKILEITRYTPDELLNIKFHDLVCEEYRETITNGLNLEKSYGEIGSYILEIYSKNNERKWLSLTIVTVREDGDIVGFEGIARDISESKKMERHQKELEQLNLNILKSITSPLFVVDKKFSVIYHNQLANEFSNTGGNLAGMNFFSLIPVEFSKNLKEPFNSLLKGDSNNLNIQIMTGKMSDEEYDRVYEVRAYPFSTSGNIMKGIFIIVDDTTFRYETERKMARADKLATIGKLASGVAHEIRNPLNIIKGIVQYIQETHPGNETISGFLDILKVEINKVTFFLEDFLSLTKQKPLQIEKKEVNVLLDSVLKFILHELDSKKIELVKEYKNESLFVFVDENQMRQVILNIIKNGIEAIGKRRIREIKIRTGFLNMKQDQQSVFLEIEDSGCGTTQKVASRIFDPFFTTKESGTGLGLAICSEIIKNHRGMISFSTELHVGSKIRILLPTENYFETSN
jgi:two-component system, sporulation sensor kinase A